MTSWYQFLTLKNEDLFVPSNQIVSIKSSTENTSIISLTSGQWYEVHWSASDIVNRSIEYEKETVNESESD
jgi:uncharacterized protein YlzI (FlbEa/FlbD family)